MICVERVLREVVDRLQLDVIAFWNRFGWGWVSRLRACWEYSCYAITGKTLDLNDWWFNVYNQILIQAVVDCLFSWIVERYLGEESRQNLLEETGSIWVLGQSLMCLALLTSHDQYSASQGPHYCLAQMVDHMGGLVFCYARLPSRISCVGQALLSLWLHWRWSQTVASNRAPCWAHRVLSRLGAQRQWFQRRDIWWM